eukprot:TRINITY_DN2086_c0_g1_i1.p1 TRINITY_DN2086_c0_g1~~TRINITY_DN2086_c0_g1_i1.p1  ORF type:complete len:149 (+),score=35.28 TRINITY_DN2086_c0_g1_i1:72-518(+)
MKFGGAPKCGRCKKSVYFAERATGPGGDWHKTCLTCKTCNKRLDSTTLTEHDMEAFCKSCYGKNFGPKGFGFGMGSAFLTTEPSGAPVVNSAGSNNPSGNNPGQQPSFSNNSPPANSANSSVPKFCPECGYKLAGGPKFCPECGNKLR